MNMSKHYSSDDEIERLALGLIDCTWPKSDWTHAAHFAATLWFLRHEAQWRPETDMPLFIRRYNEATGGENTDVAGYHETITQGSIKVARAFLAAYPASRPLHEIVDLLMMTPMGDSGWILSHWTRNRLFSTEARRRWVEPDLRPLPD
jgi:hypothetical protein